MITGKYILNMLSRAETWPEAEGFTGFARQISPHPPVVRNDNKAAVKHYDGLYSKSGFIGFC